MSRSAATPADVTVEIAKRPRKCRVPSWSSVEEPRMCSRRSVKNSAIGLGK
jgi:hypothetical protein